MKKPVVFLTFFALTAILLAQAPQKMSYQAVIRDSDDKLLSNANIGIQASILQGSSTGTAVYVERHFPSTNVNGLISIEVGSGTVISGAFNTINWAEGTFFIKTEIDLSGGANYTITAISQLLSVPFAKYADMAGNGFSGNYNDLTNKPDFTKSDKDSTDNVTLSGNQTISGNKTFTDTLRVINPTDSFQVTNKAYVDNLMSYMQYMVAGIRDNEGNIYRVIPIGTQLWMKDNLKSTRYCNGDPIPNVKVNSAWQALTTGARSYYNNDSVNYSAYGPLYNWYVVNDPRGLCPTGWHVPSHDEWWTLFYYLIANGFSYGGTGYDNAKALAYTSGWNVNATAGTVGNNQAGNNTSGFEAHTTAIRNVSGTFVTPGQTAAWWSSTIYTTIANHAYVRFLNYSYDMFSYGDADYRIGYSVRCIKD